MLKFRRCGPLGEVSMDKHPESSETTRDSFDNIWYVLLIIPLIGLIDLALYLYSKYQEISLRLAHTVDASLCVLGALIVYAFLRYLWLKLPVGQHLHLRIARFSIHVGVNLLVSISLYAMLYILYVNDLVHYEHDGPIYSSDFALRVEQLHQVMQQSENFKSQSRFAQQILGTLPQCSEDDLTPRCIFIQFKDSWSDVLKSIFSTYLGTLQKDGDGWRVIANWREDDTPSGYGDISVWWTDLDFERPGTKLAVIVHAPNRPTDVMRVYDVRSALVSFIKSAGKRVRSRGEYVEEKRNFFSLSKFIVSGVFAGLSDLKIFPEPDLHPLGWFVRVLQGAIVFGTLFWAKFILPDPQKT